MTAPSPASIECRAGALRLALRPDLGGSIAGLWHDGEPVMRSTEPAKLALPRASASYPLVPYSNRIGNRRFTWNGEAHTTAANFGDYPHSVHGIAWLRPWDVLSATGTAASIRYRHTPDAHWPFAFEVEQHHTLTPEGFTVRHRFTNLHDAAAPAGLGWHPYFPKRARSRLDIAVAGRWDSDATELPVARVPQAAIADAVAALRYDNCFDGWTGPARIADERFRIELSSDLACLVVYTPVDKDYYCVEPVSHVSNAIQMDDPVARGLRSLAPGEVFEATMSLKVTPA